MRDDELVRDALARLQRALAGPPPTLPMVRVRPRWNAWDRVDEVRLADVYGVRWRDHPGGAGKMLRAEVAGRKVYITRTDNNLSVFAEVCRRAGVPDGAPTPPLRWGEPPPRLRG